MITQEEQEQFYRVSGADLSDPKIVKAMHEQWKKVDVNGDGSVSLVGRAVLMLWLLRSLSRVYVYHQPLVVSGGV